VGGKSFLNVAVAKVLPKLADYFSAHEATKIHRDEFPHRPEGILDKPSQEVQDAGQVHGSGGRTR
jgi:hypothetical protein